jgi:hypothetical protein
LQSEAEHVFDDEGKDDVGGDRRGKKRVYEDEVEDGGDNSGGEGDGLRRRPRNSTKHKVWYSNASRPSFTPSAAQAPVLLTNIFNEEASVQLQKLVLSITCNAPSHVEGSSGGSGNTLHSVARRVEGFYTTSDVLLHHLCTGEPQEEGILLWT